MATDTRTKAPSNTTTNFRLWTAGIKDALVAVGLVQVADTGVINYATVTAPTAATQVKGFDVFRFNDTLQATKPVYLRVEYGSGAATANPYCAIAVGTATDGAGNITGPTTGIIYLRYDMTNTTTARNIYTSGVNSGAEGWLCQALWPGLDTGSATGSQHILMIDRTRDTSGVQTGDGLWVVLSNGAASTTEWFLDYTTSTAYTSPSVMTTWKNASGIIGADTYLSPIFPGAGAVGKTYSPTLCAVAYYTSDITRNTNVSVTMYGASHTFKCLGDWGFGVTYGWQGATSLNSNSAYAMRWE